MTMRDKQGNIVPYITRKPHFEKMDYVSSVTTYNIYDEFGNVICFDEEQARTLLNWLQANLPRENMRQRATVLDIIREGLAGNTEKVRAYTELLIQRIAEHGDERKQDITALQRVLDGQHGLILHTESQQDETVHTK